MPGIPSNRVDVFIAKASDEVAPLIVFTRHHACSMFSRGGVMAEDRNKDNEEAMGRAADDDIAGRADEELDDIEDLEEEEEEDEDMEEK
jgi:hypothetical protein